MSKSSSSTAGVQLNRVYLVEDSWQFDGGSYIHGIFTDANEALICQQKWRRYYSRQDQRFIHRLEAISIREVELDKEIEE